jgi:hypothetical protein
MRVLLMILCLLGSAHVRAGESMSYLDNGRIKVGFDLKLGGAITFLARAGGENMINNFDHGRQVPDALDIMLEQNDPQLIGPVTFWRAEEAHFLIIEAAFKTKQSNSAIFWQCFGESIPRHCMDVGIQPDGEFHRIVIKLSDSADYRGSMLGLRIAPVSSGSSGEWCKVKSIRLVARKD